VHSEKSPKYSGKSPMYFEKHLYFEKVFCVLRLIAQRILVAMLIDIPERGPHGLWKDPNAIPKRAL